MSKDKGFLSPFQRFVRIESFSGILLFSATVIALIWANSPWQNTYHELWQFKFGFNTPGFELNKALLLWINDGLMAVFFFLIGLEIKRELLIGELNSMKKASLPLFAAIGGMAIPALAYVLLNQSPESSHGWGIPMAADIAFSLAILKLLGNRIPLSLKIFLTAFAIVDDIGAVMVIAVFYSSGIKWMLIGAALLIIAALLVLAQRGFYSKVISFSAGVVVWLLFLKAGLHPTIAGVLMAFTIPIRQKINVMAYSQKLDELSARIKNAADNTLPVLTREQIAEIDNLEEWTDKVQSPLQHLEHSLHNWVSYLIMPLFALANAGISFGQAESLDFYLVGMLIVCLAIGNLIGVSSLVFLGIKLKLVNLPKDLTKQHIFGLAFLAGVGFTMSIFIANLAFADQPQLIDSAKLGILIGSLLSGSLGYIVLRFTKQTV